MLVTRRKLKYDVEEMDCKQKKTFDIIFKRRRKLERGKDSCCKGRGGNREKKIGRKLTSNVSI